MSKKIASLQPAVEMDDWYRGPHTSRSLSKNHIRSAAGMAVYILLGLLFFIAILGSNFALAETGVVAGEVVNVRSGPGTGYKIVGTISKGARVDIVETSGDWCRIKTAATDGWVAQSLLIRSREQIQVRVKAGSANLRSGPGTTYSQVGQVQNGTILTLIDIQGGWYQVKTSGGVIAYIAAELVEDASGTPAGTVPTASTRQVQVMDGPINVRSGPGTGYEKIGTIEDDAIVTVISESGDWLQIKLNDGRTAYVAAWLVKEVDTDLNTEAIPVVAPGQTQTAAGGTGSAPRVILNGQEMQFETPPIIDNGRTLVPLRAIFEAMGATVDWDDGTRTVTAVKGGTTVVLQVYSTAPTINGKVYSLDVVARIVNNRTLAPLRFVGEAFGGTVNWDANTRTITITGAPDVSAQATVIVNEPGASLRSGPSAGYDKIDSAAAGEKLPVLAEKDGWYQVSRGGRTAWVASWLVQKEDSSTPTQGGNTEPANPAASTQPNGADPGETVVVPVDQSSLNKRGDENAAVEEGYLSLSTCLTAKGYRLVMKSGSKTEPAISRQDNGKRIVFTFNGVKINTGRDEASFYIGSGSDARVAISAETLGLTSWVTITMPYAYNYLTGSEENGNKQVFLIPPQIKSIDEIQLKNGNQVVVIRSTSAMQYQEEYGDGEITLTLPGTYAGLSKKLTELEGDICREVKVQGGSEDTDASVRIMLKKDLETYQVTKTTAGDMISVILVPKGKTPTDTPGTPTQKKINVVLDPGHGGRDSGAKRSLSEKDINLAIALKARALLESEQISVTMTRTTDLELGPSTSADLQARADIANRLPADLFVSIHCNANTSTEPNGTETYYYAPADNQVLAAQEYQRSVLADLLQKALVSKIGRANRGVKTANYAVLRETTMPSALIETAFISNPEEEALLGQDSFQQKAAEAIAEAIKRYITLMM